jgi:LysR family transcriptional regulator AphB
MLFLALIDAGSFTLAAERVNIPKANLSRKITRLESHLGVVLLERTTRSQQLTEPGRRYLAHCRKIHDEIDLANTSISQMLNTIKGQLRIGTSVGIGQEILKPALAKFMLDYPDIELQVSLMNRRVDLITEGFDMLIRVGKLDDSRLIGKHLGSIQRKIYTSPKHLKKRIGINSIKDLEDCDLLHMSSIHSSGKLELQYGKKTKIINKAPKLLIDDFSIIKQAAIDGVGVAVIPDYMCTKEIKSKKLINILPDWGMEVVEVYALYPKHRSNIPKVKVFLDFVTEVFIDRLKQ